MRLALVVATLTGACWSDAAAVEPTLPIERPRPPHDAVARRPPPPPAPKVPIHSTWKGTYVCTQGLTGVTLTIDLDHGDAIVLFDFEPVPQNSYPVKSGTSRLKGVVQELPDGGFSIDVDPDAWVVQPPGYSMVGVSASADGMLQELHGKMKSPSCGAIDATRID